MSRGLAGPEHAPQKACHLKDPHGACPTKDSKKWGAGSVESGPGEKGCCEGLVESDRVRAAMPGLREEGKEAALCPEVSHAP